MRMKRLKHLEERKTACGGWLISANSDDLNFATAGDVKDYIDLKEWFGTERPIWLEIGCGKGQFACELAKQHPEINIIAVEKNSNVIVQACEKAQELGIENVRFLKCGAEYLTKFLKDGTVDINSNLIDSVDEFTVQGVEQLFFHHMLLSTHSRQG